MKPYLGILLDSFWEAASNRIFWALLLASTLILLAIAPFGIVVERNLSFSGIDIVDSDRLVTKLGRGLDGKGAPALRAIADRLTPDFAHKIQNAIRDPQALISPTELAGELNRLIEVTDLYARESFPTAEKRQRLAELIGRIPDGLNIEETRRLNRELLLIVFSAEITSYRAEQLWVGYAGFKMGTPLAVTQRQIKTYVEPLMLQLIVQFGLGIMIVFVAIIVTSPIIPETFRSGNLYLLLSKPISRIWLFLSKFVGGCIFVSMNLSYVLVGLYLIVGFRFGIWNKGLLACIPMLLFVYVVLYSVSALSGLIWGNAIVSVISVIIFWIFFFAVGTMHDVLQMRVEQWSQLKSVSGINGEVLSVNESGNLKVWNPVFSVWQPATEVSLRAEGLASLTFGPFDNPEDAQFLYKTFMPRGLDLTLQRPSRSLTMVQWNDRVRAPLSIEEARVLPVWSANAGPEIPEQVFRILKVNRQLVVVSRLGLYRLDLNRSNWWRTDSRSWLSLLPQGPFEVVTPVGFRFSDNTTAVPFGEDGLFVYTDGLLTTMRLERGRFQVDAQVAVEGDGSEIALLAASEKLLAVALEGRAIQIFDSNLRLLRSVELGPGERPKQLSWVSNSDCLLVLLHSGELLECKSENPRPIKVRLPVGPRVTCINTDDPHCLWLGLIPNHAACISWPNCSLQRYLEPVPTRSEVFYYRIVRPLYRFNPKPTALNQTMHYLLTGDSTYDPQLIPIRMDNAQVQLDIWQPIVSNLVFVIFVLFLSCTYLSWKEF